jgi:predicted Zn-dependent peptidase
LNYEHKYKDNAPASSVAVVVKAGSRAESIDNVGVAHFLKNFAFKVRN